MAEYFRRSSAPRAPWAAGVLLRRGASLSALALSVLLGACGPSAEDLYSGEPPERVDFNFHVKPILSDRCFACHGPDANARKADLRLDTEEGARAVIRAGSLRRSQVFHRIVTTDSSEMMPPRESGLTLSDYQKAVLARWIEQGAEYKPHWAFLPPQKPELPKVRDARWARHPIDRFVLARLEREGLKPSPEADRERLLRRVTYDLTGLPPTVQEIDRFLADRSPNAYEKVVDRLLASPAYGERMAIDWMDLARYADSNGYQDDGARHMWRWRDWVIDSFNRNQRYDEFATWQVAGDLLPNPTREQILATGFNRNHPQNGEGGIVDEEYRVEYVADRTNTFSRAFMGMSMECARCHDHKYDPITQKDYFRVFAFFNNNDEIGVSAIDSNTGPVMVLLDDTTRQRLAGVRRRIAEEEQALRSYRAQIAREGKHLKRPEQPAPDLRRGLVAHFPLDDTVGGRSVNLADPALPLRVSRGAVLVPGKVGGGLEIREGPGSVEGPYYFERNEPFSLSAYVNPSRRRAQSPLLSLESSGNRHHRGYQLALDSLGRVTATVSHSWPTNSIRIVTRDTVPLKAWTHLVMTYDGSSRAAGLRLYVNGRLAPSTVAQDRLSRTIIWLPKIDFLVGAKGGSTDPSLFPGGRIDDVRIYDRTLTSLEAARLGGLDPFREFRERAPAQWSAGQRSELLEYHLATADGAYPRKLDELRKIRAEENRLLSMAEDVMIMQELPKPRPTFVLNRGLYDAPGEPVRAGTPGSIGALQKGLPANRLGLARWLFDPGHPLTARVAVNRYWQMLFGTGLVKTADEFGNQGELPSHPELLDWLAVTYRTSGWDTKALMKLMVTSATYRQASAATPTLLEKDPENRLLARGPSYRLPFEMVRDAALATSGLLVPKVGGPSVKPYQPAGLWEEKSAGRGSLAKYVQDTGESLYRRSLYTFWKRSSPPPAMVAFDVADRSVCTIRRARTNTPLQALGLLNDPQFVEAARLLAERMVREGGSAVDQRLRFGFRLATARSPSPREMELLRALHRKQRTHVALKGSGSLKLLQVGEWKRDERLAADEVATYTVVANTLLNLDEFVTKR